MFEHSGREMSESLREVPSVVPYGDSLFLALLLSKLLEEVFGEALGGLLHGHEVHVCVASCHSSSETGSPEFYSGGEVLLERVKVFVLD